MKFLGVGVSEYQMVRYHYADAAQTEDWHRVALAWTGGRTRLHLVMQVDTGIVKMSVPMDEQRFCTPLMRNGLPYTVERGAKYLLNIGRRAGITQGAKDLLDAAISGKETA